MAQGKPERAGEKTFTAKPDNKKGRKNRPFKMRQVARSITKSPGGWGAEKSEVSAEPGRLRQRLNYVCPKCRRKGGIGAKI